MLFILLISCLISMALGKPIQNDKNIIPTSNEIHINHAKGSARFLYQGDIAVLRRHRRWVSRQKNHKWDLPLPYSFDERFPKRARRRVHDAMRFWSDKTCVTFKQTDTIVPRLNIFEGVGCWSFVGRQPYLTEQGVSLEPSCIDHTFVVAHELAHSLGFYHEHARPDRDDFIKIDYSNLSSNASIAFDKEDSRNPSLYTNYEYGSVMHYSADQFASNPNRAVIYAKNANFEQTMGNRMRITFNDITRMNNLYNCHERCAGVKNNCKYGGYPSPNNCSVCICPDGFGGDYCDQVETPANTLQYPNPFECQSETLWATNKTKTFSARLSTSVRSNNHLSAPLYCFWHIRSLNQADNVEIRIKSIISPCSITCAFNAIELKLSNFTMTGYRFCCDEHIYDRNMKPKPFYTTGPLAVIGAYARYDYVDFEIEYRAVSNSNL